MKKTLALPLLWSAACFGQGYVSNAIGSTSSSVNVLAPEMLAVLQDYSLPGSTLGPARVFIRPAGSMQAIAVTTAAVSSGVVNGVTFVVPAGIPPGTAQLIWQFNGEPYQSIDVTVATNNFELLLNGPNGSAIAQVLNTAGSPATVGLTTPARPGQTIALTGSGLGYGTQVSATIGGLPATVLYAGRGTPAGIDQIQLQIPAAVTDGCYVPLLLQVGNSNLATAISVTSDGTPCRHPLGLSLSDLKNLDSGGLLNVTEVDVNSQLNATLSFAVYRGESASASSSQISAGGVAQYFTPAVFSGCSATSTEGLFAIFGAVNQSPGPDNSLTLTNGTNAVTATEFDSYSSFVLPPSQDGTLASPPAPFFAPGAWMLKAPASSDLPASSFGFTLPAPVQLSGGAPVSLRRDQDQTISWNGAGFDPGTVAQISLSGHASDGVSGRSVSCAVSARAGSVTIPAALLAAFAPASIGTVEISLNPGPAAIPGTVFRTSSGSPLAFVIAYFTYDTRPVDFQ